MADRLRRVPAADRVGVEAARAVPDRRAVLPEPAREQIVWERREVADRPDAVTREGRRRTSHRRPTAARSRGARGRRPRSPGGTTTSPSGFRRSEAIFATSFVLATPTEIVRSTASRDRRLHLSADGLAITEQRPRAGDVEERLVDRDRLDKRREPFEHSHDVSADGPVLGTVDRQKDAVGTQSAGRSQRHRRMNAELPSLIARRATPRRDRAGRRHRRSPACRAAPAGPAARPPRRRRRGRHGGSSGRRSSLADHRTAVDHIDRMFEAAPLGHSIIQGDRPPELARLAPTFRGCAYGLVRPRMLARAGPVEPPRMARGAIGGWPTPSARRRS